MEFKIKNESEILDPSIRKAAIAFFCADENTARKQEAIRREEVYKDMTKKYVIDAFMKESMDANIKQEIYNRSSNISISKKIINKKASVYRDGAKRICEQTKFQQGVDLVVDYLNLNTVMKQVNRINELHYNSIASCFPYNNNGEWYLKLKAYSPDKYDVLVKAEDPELALVYVFSYETTMITKNADEQNQGVRGGARGESSSSKSNYYVWWSNSYHFTTDSKGTIIDGLSEAGNINPIGICPIIDFSKMKNGQFFNCNGADITDGAILINILLTDMYYISKYQGMGVGYAFGKGIPQNLKVGPSSFITVQMEVGDPTPELGFASSNPPIDQHIAQIEQALALLLSSNSLDAGVISGSLSAGGAESGVQEIVRKAENIDDIEDQREIYRDKEPEVFKVALSWLEIYRNVNPESGYLTPILMEVGEIPIDMKIALRFNHAEVYSSELDKLNVIEKRLDIGLDTIEDAMKKDNPDLTDDEIRQKIEAIKLKCEEAMTNGEQGNVQDESEKPGDDKREQEGDSGRGGELPERTDPE